MIQIKRILTPTDCSEMSKEAILYAMELNKIFKAKLTILNIASPHRVSNLTEISTDMHQRMKAETSARNKKTFEDFWNSFESAGADVELVQEKGDAFIEIIQYATKYEQDLIVIGTHGRTGLLRIMMGSVAEKVLRYSPIPVLTVKHKDVNYEAIARDSE